MWSVTFHWEYRLWDFSGGISHGQPQPVFHPGPPSMNYKAICRWLLLVLGLGLLSKKYGVGWEAGWLGSAVV